jgi:hypothetical protein
MSKLWEDLQRTGEQDGAKAVTPKKKRTKRIGLTKTIRFEVFKRDNFTCQYCGAKAPEAVLRVDHIKPVAEGGDNHAMNLITSCFPCNAGKGAREISDNAILDKQRQQIEELNERRLQLEMMMEWRNEVLSLDGLKVEKLVSIINGKSPKLCVSQAGIENVEKWVKQFSFEEIVAAIDEAYRIYFKDDEDSWRLAFSKVAGVVKISRASVERPYLRKLFYIRGILRNNLSYIREHDVLPLLERAVESGIDLDHLERMCKYDIRSWSQFVNVIEDFLFKNRGKDGADS